MRSIDLSTYLSAYIFNICVYMYICIYIYTYVSSLLLLLLLLLFTHALPCLSNKRSKWTNNFRMHHTRPLASGGQPLTPVRERIFFRVHSQLLVVLPATCLFLRDTAGYLISCSRWEGHSYHKPTNKQNGRTRPPHQYCQQAW